MDRTAFIQYAAIAFLPAVNWDVNLAIAYAERLWQRISERGYGAQPEPETPAARPSPKKRGQKRPADSTETWNAYAEAYMEHFGAEPLRDADVNRHLARFVARVGREDAPAIARFYVGHPNAYYRTRGYNTKILVDDADKLRTEWLTGARMTGAKARQEERSSTTVESARELLRELEGRP